MAIELDPDIYEFHADLAYYLTELDRFDEAVVHYEKALELKPKKPWIHNNLGYTLNLRGHEGDYVKALKHLNRAIKLDPSSPNYYAHRADSRRKLAEKETERGESGKLVAATLQDIIRVYDIVTTKGDMATNGDYNAVVRATYNARRIFGTRGEDATSPLDDQDARQAVLQHLLVQQGIKAGKLTEEYVLQDFKAPV